MEKRFDLENSVTLGVTDLVSKPRGPRSRKEKLEERSTQVEAPPLAEPLPPPIYRPPPTAVAEYEYVPKRRPDPYPPKEKLIQRSYSITAELIAEMEIIKRLMGKDTVGECAREAFELYLGQERHQKALKRYKSVYPDLYELDLTKARRLKGR